MAHHQIGPRIYGGVGDLDLVCDRLIGPAEPPMEGGDGHVYPGPQACDVRLHTLEIPGVRPGDYGGRAAGPLYMVLGSGWYAVCALTAATPAPSSVASCPTGKNSQVY